MCEVTCTAETTDSGTAPGQSQCDKPRVRYDLTQHLLCDETLGRQTAGLQLPKGIPGTAPEQSQVPALYIFQL